MQSICMNYNNVAKAMFTSGKVPHLRIMLCMFTGFPLHKIHTLIRCSIIRVLTLIGVYSVSDAY